MSHACTWIETSVRDVMTSVTFISGTAVTTYTLDPANPVSAVPRSTRDATRRCAGRTEGTNGQGTVVSAWTFDPDGLVLEGPEGPVSHLMCKGTNDWSTGLIHKDRRYFALRSGCCAKPTLGIWLALMPPWRKLALLGQLNQMAKSFAMSDLRRRHPGATEQELRRRLGAGSGHPMDGD